MVHGYAGLSIAELKLLCAKQQIETELSKNGQFDPYPVQTDIALTIKADEKPDWEETADLLVHNRDKEELYMIRPFFCSVGELYEILTKQMECVQRACCHIYGRNCVPGGENFLYISPCRLISSELLIYWCSGDGKIYYQFCQKSKLHILTKLFVCNLNFSCIQQSLGGKYT